ncbi:kelch-like protein 4 [Cephus cinctus]|uniref:Kelch-like protein 4 n=1 Tax=Cephus cinctus TaxID=211228 RepID=A0AAJ7FMN7_CEPCN|nr:kelch-like protein 4 [Cephus cinctus]XP_015599345.1 kelch-like protein 4 [Cephus cinctus]
MDGSQQFNLRWNNHTNNILQVFLEHLSTESLVDVTLSCQGQFIKAHRMILSACSPYFQELFKHHTTKHPVIILNGIKYQDLQMMIRFMYHGEIRVQEAQLEDLLAAAETLQVKGLSNVRNKYEKGEIQSNPIDKTLTSCNPMEKETTGNILTNSTMGVAEEAFAKVCKRKNMAQDSTRIRNKRKMSHTVNELAKETVFASNGTVCLEPESNSGICGIKPEWSPLIKIEPPSTQTSDKNQEKQNQISGELKPMRLRGKSKSGQKAIIVPEKMQMPRKIPRPPNAFMLFANEWRRKLAFEYPNESNTEISVRLGIMWKGLNIQAKESYYALAKKVDEEHKRKYPGYYYSPKEARLRKNLKQDLMLARCLPTTDADALRLVKVLMNVDERQTGIVRVSPGEEEMKEDIDDPSATVTNISMKNEDIETKSVTSIIT